MKSIKLKKIRQITKKYSEYKINGKEENMQKRKLEAKFMINKYQFIEEKKVKLKKEKEEKKEKKHIVT